MIPKIIHYCWFGRKPLPELAKKCIESWEKFLPDYEVKKWNEDNFDINIIPYVKEAYEAKKFAFVSDFARFWILYNYGGIYFDTDVELIKPLEPILKKSAYMGCEVDGTNNEDNEKILVNPGLGIACNSGLPIYKEFIEGYKNRHFIKDDGTFDTTVVCTYTTDILKKYGLKNIDSIQNVADIIIYPEEYFCPINYYTGKTNYTVNTYSVHHYAGSWLSEAKQFELVLKKRLCYLPNPLKNRVAWLIVNIKFNGFLYILKRLKNKII